MSTPSCFEQFCGCLPFLRRNQCVTSDALARARSRIYVKAHPLGVCPSDFYSSGQQIGEGGFGKVQQVESKQSGEKCVMKVMWKAGIPDIHLFLNEVSIHSEMDHPNIASLHELFEDKYCIYLVMHACKGGEVLDFLRKSGVLTEKEARVVLKQCLAAIRHLHSVSVVHRDIKLQNLLVDEKDKPLTENSLMLIDFGFAKRFTPGKNSLRSVCGSPYYMAPEMLTERYNEKCDIYSTGIMLYLLLSGEEPFHGGDPIEIMEVAAKKKLPLHRSAFKTVSPLAKVFLAELCTANVEHRPTAEKALENQWLHELDAPEVNAEDAQSILKNLVRFQKVNPFKRQAMIAAARHSACTQSDQMVSLRQAFEAFDKDGGGRISREEVDDALAKTGMDPEAQKRMRLQLSVFFTKDKQYLSYSEFLAANAMRQLNTKKTCVWEAFRAFDTDGDGVITHEEFMGALAEGGQLKGALTEEEADRIFNECDLDGKHVISFEEFMTMLQADGSPGSRDPSKQRS